MSCNNNSSGFCAFGSNWWWVIILILILFWNGNGEWQWLWLRQRLRLLTGLHRKSKTELSSDSSCFLWFHAAKQPVDRDVQNICKGV